MFSALKQFIFLENAQDRYVAIKNYAQNSNSWQLNLLTWQILSLLPTNKEKVTLAQSLKITSVPGSEWAIFTYLLEKEHDTEVTRECILNLAKTKYHTLGNRVRKAFQAKIPDPEVLSAILEYIEKTEDERFKDFLENNDIFLHTAHCSEQILNAFEKLRVINTKAKDLCFQLLEEYKDKDTTDSKIYSAVFYIFFSAHMEDFPKLQQLKIGIKNSKLLKVFDLCYFLLKPIAEGQKEIFFETALLQQNPLFLGYGILSQVDLEKLLPDFLNKYSKSNPVDVTKTILSLKSKYCTDILSKDKNIGIHVLEKHPNNNIIEIWLDICPLYNENFINSVKNPRNYKLWHNHNHLGFVILDYSTLFHSTNPLSALWQDFFTENLLTDISISINIIFFQINAFGNSNSPYGIIKQQEENSDKQNHEAIIIKNISIVLEIIRQNQYDTDLFIDKIYALCISAKSTPQFMKEIYNLIPFSCTSWAFIAIALTAPKIDVQTLNYAILRELHIIRETLLNESPDKDEYILEVTTRFQSIIIGADKFHLQVTQPTLIALKEIANLIQNILDTIENEKEGEELNSENAIDWNGHAIVDKPIMRWNAILQVCLNQFLEKEELYFYEKILCDSLKIAPHVEKRWVVRALVRLDTDDAIKTILYQALHHIDSDFVERTVSELFSSKHARAKQALIRSISKNNISEKMKIAIVERMKNFTTTEILHEFKDLLLIRLPEKLERSVQDAIMNISSKTGNVEDTEIKEHKFTSAEIDILIKTSIQNVHLLSVDSRSALRTAEMIFIQSKDWGREAVDLSPIVNMYCKSVELVLRDTFEPFTDSIMRKGELSKKLDALGYTKSIQEKMQDFEDYVADLPVINTIPYFSKFKLRKMLRAICLYRPGKRFTLDGPKAFALFLLVTARKSCPYSLAKLFNLQFLTDLELYDFVKQVHSLQDSRNRAVHEGLTWDAREEIDNMRKQAYCIIDTCLKIGIKLNHNASIENEARAF